MSHTSLQSALDRINANLQRERQAGHEDLKRILRQARANPRPIIEANVQHGQNIFEVLATLVESECAAYRKASTRSAALTTSASRLTAASAAYRLCIEICGRHVKWSKVKEFLLHLTNTFTDDETGICEPLALDNVKTINEILAYRPHLEHVPTKEWRRLCRFATSHLDLLSNMSSSSSNHANASSSRSSQGSRGNRLNSSMQNHLLAEFAKLLRLLTSSTAVPVYTLVESLIDSLIRSLGKGGIPGSPEVDLLMTLNQVLARSDTEATPAIKARTPDLLRIIDMLWVQLPARLVALREELLSSQIMLLPFTRAAIISSSSDDNTVEVLQRVQSIAEHILQEYSDRLPKDLLDLHDIRLVPNSTNNSFNLPALSLQAIGPDAQRNWSMLLLWVYLSDMSLPADHIATKPETSSPKRKRRRIDSRCTSLLRLCRGPALAKTITGLQLIAVTCQVVVLDEEELVDLVTHLQILLNDEKQAIAAWASIALACCAGQRHSGSEHLRTVWQTIWTHSLRAMASPSTCRTACHLVTLLITNSIMEDSRQSGDLVSSFRDTLELHGPTTCDEASITLVLTVINIAGNSRRAIAGTLATSAVEWLFRTWNPDPMASGDGASFRHIPQLSDAINLLSACLHTSDCVVQPWWSRQSKLHQDWTHYENALPILSYLLLLRPDENEHCSNSNPSSKASSKCSDSTRSPTAARLLQWCKRAVGNMLQFWAGSQPITSATTGNIESTILLLRLCQWIQTIPLQDCGTLLSDQNKLMTATSRYLASADSRSSKINNGLTTFLSTIFRKDDSERGQHVLLLENTWYGHIYGLLPTSEASDVSHSVSNDEQFGDGQDSDFESAPRPSVNSNNRQTSQVISTLMPEDMSIAVCARLYTKLLSGLAESGSQQLEPFYDELRSMTSDEMVAGQAVIVRLVELGAELTAKTAFEILDHLCVEVLQNSYAQSHAGAARAMVVQLWAQCSDLWIFTDDKDLHGVSIDIYDDCLQNLSRDTLLPETQTVLASSLLKIWRQDENFAQNDAEPPPSPRSAVIQLISQGRLFSKYRLAAEISAVFGCYAISLHEKLYDDLEQALPNDADSSDGIAIRIAFLANLGTRWNSLLRKSVWQIFDAAGQVPLCIDHAAQAIDMIRKAHGLEDSAECFRLFSSQLIFTWQTDRSVANMPFSVFGYRTLPDLIRDNLDELVAQSYLFGKLDDLETIRTTVDEGEAFLIRRSFATTFTYAMAHDISQASQTQHQADHESTLRSHFSKDDYILLVRRYLPHMAARLLLSTHIDSSVERILEKRSSMNFAVQTMTSMKSFASDGREPAPALEPSFKVRHFFDAIERLVRRANLRSTDLFSGALFVSVARVLFDSWKQCLGPLQARAIVHKARLLCALGEKALDCRYAVELLVRNLRPFLDDPFCADDTAGVLQYVFNRGKKAMTAHSGNLSSLVTSAFLTIDALKKGAIRPRSTLNSQSQATRTNMHKFQAWLIEYLTGFEEEVHQRHKATILALINNFGSIQYPAEFRRECKASTYLITLLDDGKSSRPFLEESDRVILVRSLVSNSKGAPVGDDVLQKHTAASRYATSIWRTLKTTHVSEEVSQWLGKALGQSYSYGGPEQVRRMLLIDGGDAYTRSKDFDTAIQNSRLVILRELVNLLSSNKPNYASAAEEALRTAINSFHMTGDVETVKSLLPAHVFEALDTTTTPSNDDDDLNAKGTRNGRIIKDAGSMCSDMSARWPADMAQQLIMLAFLEPLAGSLRLVVEEVEGFADAVIGPLCHLALCSADDEAQAARKWVSGVCAAAFSRSSSLIHTRHLIALVMYLLKQPIQKESIRTERLEWLDVNFLSAARCAVKFGMAKHALLLAEIAPGSIQHTRSSRRASSQASSGHADIPNDLLLAIYDDIDDPDCFYAVERDPSLQNIFQRVDREANPFKSLLLHSAYLDASKRINETIESSHSVNTMVALSNLNLHTMTQVLLEHSRQDDFRASDTALTTSRKLYDWDVQLSENSSSAQVVLFGAFQQLHNAFAVPAIQSGLAQPITQALRMLFEPDLTRETATSALHALAVINDIQTLVDCTSASGALALQRQFADLQSGWDIGQHAELIELISNRESIFGVFRRNLALQNDLKIGPRDALLLEAQAVLQSASASRDLGQKKGSLTAATYLNRLISQCEDHDLHIEVAAIREMASVLWLQDEPEVSIQLLQTLVTKNHPLQDIPVDRAGLLSQLGHEIAEARFEKPGDIIEKYLKPALQSLTKSSTNQEAASVYFEFASFCDQQLQNPDNQEELRNILALKMTKEKEQRELRELDKRTSDKSERHEVRRRFSKAKQWLELDSQEYSRLVKIRNELVTQALSNYLKALAASDKHDACVVRFFALWLDHDGSAEAQKVVAQSLKDVPSWKFVTLLNQIMSRLQDTGSDFQTLLAGLVSRICGEHPYHSVYHLFASVNVEIAPNDPSGKLRKSAAEKIAHTVKSSKKAGQLVSNVWTANSLYHNLATSSIDSSRTTKFSIQQIPAAREMNKRIPPMQIPPATLALRLRPRADYRDVPYIARFRDDLSIASGLSAPKVVTVRSSDGGSHKMLFKGGNDDLRQDAIMEQVFSSVSSMLRNHTETRRRNLHIRTYVVLPLTHTSGIIEFVPNSLPLHDFVVPAHTRYHPSDLHPDRARTEIKKAQDQPRDARVRTYQAVTARYAPVLRHFFLERFESAAVWFEKRTAYARSTAAISILGHVLGLGDRHCHNILLDELSGEAVHIDLGVAFEMGRVLPVPEVVPFRLTRDIVDGMGVTGTEGVFRRCCEFTLQALREEKAGIMTLLNVLRYDPLYSWTVSPLRAKRMMEEEEQQDEDIVALGGKKRREEGPAEAERALAVVEKKLGKALSVKATVAELIQVARDEKNLAVLFAGWAAYS